MAVTAKEGSTMFRLLLRPCVYPWIFAEKPWVDVSPLRDPWQSVVSSHGVVVRDAVVSPTLDVDSHEITPGELQRPEHVPCVIRQSFSIVISNPFVERHRAVFIHMWKRYA